MRYREKEEKVEKRGSRLELVSGSRQLAMDGPEMERRGNRARSLDR
jgi:hypothetical protein